jgi:predicted transcriptional regulator
MERKTNHFNVRLTPAEKERLDRIAQLTQRSRGGVIRALLSVVDPRDLADLPTPGREAPK